MFDGPEKRICKHCGREYTDYTPESKVHACSKCLLAVAIKNNQPLISALLAEEDFSNDKTPKYRGAG